jgi:hypothetical protein
MKSPTLTSLLVGTFATAVLACSFGQAQMSVEKVNALNKTLQAAKSHYNKMTPRTQKMLDGAANIVAFANFWEKHGMSFTDPLFAARVKSSLQASRLAASAAAPVIPSIVPASNPVNDVEFSSFGGFTQNETSTARCGNNVVVGFNDSGSVFETQAFFDGIGGQSLAGFAFSSNGGASFTDGGVLNPGPGNGALIASDPVLSCSDANTFFYSELFDFLDNTGNPFTAVSLNKSTDGGQTWGDPVPAVTKYAFTHSLDKPWSTIDPAHHNIIYVSYTDFDGSGTVCGFDKFKNPIFRTAIEFVQSKDGGKTWSAPHVAIEFCADPNTGISGAIQGSQLAVNSKGVMYLSWVNLGTNFPFSARSIQISSFKGGVLTAPVTAAVIVPGGDSFFLQGEFRDFLDMAMTVDHSGTPSDGTLYLSWADGRDKIVPDPFGSDGAYAFDDVLLSQSFDGGNTWFGPFKVNSDIQPRLANGHDHYQVGIAVDSRGFVGACWYDRRSDPQNFAIRRHCGESSNNGFTFSDSDIGLAPFAPTHSGDIILNPVYMGDYDQLTSDFTNANTGFVGAFQTQTTRGNPDAVVHGFN